MPAPLTSVEFLRKLEAPGYPGVFVLGSFARYVTFYSQQVRALNLIYALAETERIAAGTPIVIIGAGAAGITAAAAAAKRGGKVTLLEKHDKILSVQRHSTKRYLHPHIYDWPEEGSLSPDASLPVLTWSADDAHKVVEQIDARWKAILADPSIDLSFRTKVSKVSLQARPYELPIVKWDDNQSSGNANRFRVVILALGFGLEKDVLGQTGYWKDAGLEDDDTKPKWLVSGVGDGGLTDLMRLCLRDFKHSSVISMFAGMPELPQIQAELLASDPSRLDWEVLAKKFRRIDTEALRAKLKEQDMLRELDVTLNGGDSMFQSGSSILNRFIVFQLAQMKAFRWISGPSKPPQMNAENNYSVEFEEGGKDTFDRVVLRHGVQSPLQDQFKDIWDACKTQREEFAKTPQMHDATKIPIWPKDDYGEDSRLPPMPVSTVGALRKQFESPNVLRCLLLSSDKDGVAWPPKETPAQNAVRVAIDYKKNDLLASGFEQVDQNPVVLPIRSALASAEDFLQTARALCAAPLVVVDITPAGDGAEYDPGIMLLLGIRSVVRRGVTIAISGLSLKVEDWAGLPFDIKEINPLPLDDSESLGRMIESGLSQFRRHPHYLDLPAYEAVRRLGSTIEDYAPIPMQEQVLLLCSFKDTYLEGIGKFLGKEMLAVFKKGGPPLKRVNEIISPRLVSHRLYDAIRRSSLCLVDWTEWRANVFFEMGVRYASSSLPVVCLLAADDPPEKAKDIQKYLLQRLFRPVVYDPKGGAGQFTRIESLYAGEDVAMEGISGSDVFEVISNAIRVEDEAGALLVHEELTSSAAALIGEDPRMQGSLPLLYAENGKLKEQARSAAIERVLAAWYYLRLRHKPQSLPATDPRRKAFLKVSRQLLLMLNDDGPDGKLLAKIDRIRVKLESDK